MYKEVLVPVWALSSEWMGLVNLICLCTLQSVQRHGTAHSDRLFEPTPATRGAIVKVPTDEMKMAHSPKPNPFKEFFWYYSVELLDPEKSSFRKRAGRETRAER